MLTNAELSLSTFSETS